MGEVIPFPAKLPSASVAASGGVVGGLPWYLQIREGMGGQSFRDPRFVCLDFETTSADHGDSRTEGNRIVLACVKDSSAPARACELEELAGVLARSNVLIAHNAKFELGWLMRHGLPWEHLLVYDTMLAERVRYGNQLVPVSLDATCARYGLATKDPLIDSMMKGGVDPADMPEHLLLARCLRDVETTYQLYIMQLDALNATGQLNVVFTRCIFTPVLAALEREGLWLDKERVYAEFGRVGRELADIDRAIGSLAMGRNLRSPVQRAEVLYDLLKFPAPKRYGKPVLTASGLRPTDKHTINDLKAKTKKQIRFLDLYKRRTKLDARMTKSLKFFQCVCVHDNGHFFGQVHQTRTATHRTSSTALPRLYAEHKKPLGAQLQNLPREYKKLFCSPDPDYQIVEVDGAQLEFRVAAYLGQDKVAISDIVRGEDIHLFTASVLFQKLESHVTSEERTAAKPETFKPLYGGESGSPAQVTYYRAFRQKYNAIYITQMQWLSKVLKDKEISMPWGMKFYFPNARLKADGYCPDKPSVFNYPVQNLATAEIIPVSLTYLFWRGKLNGIRSKLINTVHDSGVALVHKEDLTAYKQIAKQAFLTDTYRYLQTVYGLHFNVPLGLGFKAGTHWGEGVEEKFSEANKETA